MVDVVCPSQVPVAAGRHLRHHHPAPPGLQVPLGGHLAARGVLVHLPDPLHLSAAAQTHVGGRLHVRSFIHRRCKEGQTLTFSKMEAVSVALQCCHFIIRDISPRLI